MDRLVIVINITPLTNKLQPQFPACNSRTPSPTLTAKVFMARTGACGPVGRGSILMRPIQFVKNFLYLENLMNPMAQTALIANASFETGHH